MAAKVIWQPQANKQLEDALDQCEALFGKKVTHTFYQQIKHHDELLSNQPHLGHYEPLLNNRSEGFRSIVAHKHYKLVYHIIHNGDEESIISIIDMWDTRCNPQSLIERIR